MSFSVILTSLSTSRRYFSVDSISTWHSLTTMRSSSFIARFLLRKLLKARDTAASGVARTMRAQYSGCLLSYLAHLMPALLQRSLMSSCSALRGAMTTVMLPSARAAGSMKRMLLLAPVGMTTRMRSLRWKIALRASCCLLRSSAVSSPIKVQKDNSTSAVARAVYCCTASA